MISTSRILLHATMLLSSAALIGAELHFTNAGPTPLTLSNPTKASKRSQAGKMQLRAGLETSGPEGRPRPIGLMPIEDGMVLEVGPGQSAWIQVPDAKTSRGAHFLNVSTPGQDRKVLCALNANAQRASLQMLGDNGRARMTQTQDPNRSTRYHFNWTEERPELYLAPADAENPSHGKVFVLDPEAEYVFIPNPEVEWTFIPDPEYLAAQEASRAKAKEALESARADLRDREKLLSKRVRTPAPFPSPNPVLLSEDRDAADWARARARVRALRAERLGMPSVAEVSEAEESGIEPVVDPELARKARLKRDREARLARQSAGSKPAAPASPEAQPQTQSQALLDIFSY